MKFQKIRGKLLTKYRLIEPKYLKFREKSKLRKEFYLNKIKIFFDKTKLSQVTRLFKWTKPRLKQVSFFSFQTLIEGALTYFTFIGFYKPYHLVHSIFAFGFAPYIVGKYSMKIWKRYIQGKLVLQGEYVNKQEVEEKMEMKQQGIEDDLG